MKKIVRAISVIALILLLVVGGTTSAWADAWFQEELNEGGGYEYDEKYNSHSSDTLWEGSPLETKVL
ncbi:MAG: hypothetical protein ACLFU5_08890 [Thermoplasmata archaeon]